jgi:hypothetical protein
MKKLTITAVALLTALAGIAPANAFPLMGQGVGQPKVEAGTTAGDVQQVQYWRPRGNQSDRAFYGRHGGWNGHRGWDRRHGDWRGDRYYRRHHHGSNAGAIIGGLAAGAIIGGVLAQPRTVYRGGSHSSWCAARYRSYRASDNTYQPYNGPRRQCVSP